MGEERDYAERIVRHYEGVWGCRGMLRRWGKGPVEQLPEAFGVLEFAPGRDRSMWTYATVCMSQPEDPRKVELHLLAPQQAEDHVELLTLAAQYHRTGARLDWAHTVNFGRPWLPGSLCDHGLLSLPYLDGEKLEICELGDGQFIRFVWLIPITPQEVEFKKRNGLDKLEEVFEQSHFNYLDPQRPSVV